MALEATSSSHISKHRKKKRKFQRGDEVTKAIEEGGIVEVSTLATPEQKTDIRSVSTTLHTQGVTGLFLQCIVGADDVELVSEAMAGLSLLYFPCIVSTICNESVMGKICFYCLTRYDCFFPGLSLVCEIIYHATDICRAAGVGVAQIDEAIPELSPEGAEAFMDSPLSGAITDARALINSFIMDFDVITVLIKAMQLSGWVFHMKGKVYRALARLAGHALFYDKLKKENGIPVLVYEHRLRRQAQKQNNRKSSTASLSSKKTINFELLEEVEEEEDDNDDEFTDELIARLKRDYACIKIQACCRTFMTRQRHVRLLELLGKLKNGATASG